jgi:hypothetical protein
MSNTPNAEPAARPHHQQTRTVATQRWVKDPKRPGYLKLRGLKDVGEVYRELGAVVGDHPAGANEYFQPVAATRTAVPWPEGRIVVFVVTVGNEGHYTHVVVLADAGRHRPVLLAKTFDGFDAAWGFAQRIARLLDI